MPSRPDAAMRPRRRAVLAILGAGVLCGPLLACANHSNAPGATSAASASRSAIPLTQHGQARAAVRALEDAAGSHDAIKLDISPDHATLTIARNSRPLSWAWSNGVVAPTTSDITDVHQTSFDPDAFDLDDVASLFTRAAAVSGSTSNQQLQIVEYNAQQVLMSVTTNPESVPVFFRADASMITTVDLGSATGITEALRDCLAGARSVTAIGYHPDSGLYVQVPGEHGGTLDQTTRPANLPRWTTTIKGSASAAFDPGLLRPDVVAGILARLGASPSARTGTPTAGASVMAQPDITWVVDRRDALARQPVMRFTARGQNRDFLLDGTEVTSLYEGP